MSSFSPVNSQVDFPALDHAHLRFWDERAIFEKTLELAKGKPSFVFFEGPPTANGMPHSGHVLTRIMKDVFLRYRSMCGYHVPRRAGWDTHGLPVEVEVEKALGISGKDAIAEYGVEAFSRKCIDSVFKYIEEWRRMTRRIGFWVDLDDAYVTFHKAYVESVWWALKELHGKGLLYQDYKVLWWWAQGGTALSAGEVGQGYKEVDDPSVVIRFPIKGRDGEAFLAWTTTPWTLPSNIALAVKATATYQRIKTEDGSILVCAEALVSSLFGDAEVEVLSSVTGEELVGLEYEAPFSYAEPTGGPAHRVITADFVELGTGTGLVHMAPAFGEDDFRVCKAAGLGFLQLVKPDGTFPTEVTDFAGQFCKDADRDIIRHLRASGALFKEEIYRHEYPFCWRKSSDPLIQYARKSWFIRTTREIERTKANNQEINWEPKHIKDGRFGQFLEGNVDWALSRERFWGTPLPIWINDETGAMDVVGSEAEILERNPDAFAHFEAAKEKDPSLAEDLKVHKPWVDEVTWTKPGEAGVYRRIPEVIDCWFDSGCMPFAQWGYPHKNKEAFEASFPADFITEAVDQTRGWFYSLLTISTLLFEEKDTPHPFRNCVVLGLLTDEKGKKQSKSLKNYTDPMIIMEKSGGDAMRWALYSATVPGQNTRFFERAATDAVREFLLKIWNVYSFFVTYANIDGFGATSERPPISERPDMDRWILAELDATTRLVREELDGFRSHTAARHIHSFVDALSNWYVRRSRSRFWASGVSADKTSAFATLYEVLRDLSAIVSPFVPFIAEELHQNLRRADEPESIHLMPFPEGDDERQDEELRNAVTLTRGVVALGQRVRSEEKLKVRQPLGEAVVVVADDAERAAIDRFSSAIREELNVETLSFTDEPAKYVNFDLVPNFRALGPKLGKRMPLCKKALAAADGSKLHEELEGAGSFTLVLSDGESIQLGPEEVEIRLAAKEGFAAAASGGQVVVLDTQLTDALVRAGLAREVISRLQKERKERDLAFDARIMVEITSTGVLQEALQEHSAHIAKEILAESFEVVSAVDGGVDHDVGELSFTFKVSPKS
ncbi:MAG: isoleucine--tRNA ligase [Polyangiales bacterium]